MSKVLVEEFLIVKFRVTIESQPNTVVVGKIYVPLCVYVVPFQTNVSHAVTFCVILEELLIVKFKVAILSHPSTFVVR